MSQGITRVENMDYGEERQITDVSGQVRLAKGRRAKTETLGPCVHCHQNWGGAPLRAAGSSLELAFIPSLS